MENKVYLIYRDSCDDSCEIKGYILGTKEDADAYCEKLNKGHEFYWEDYDWVELDCLNPKR
jgi:hypothetical protein